MSSKLNRIVQMDALIRSKSYPSVKTFKERFEVGERAIYLDLAYFRETLRAPLAYDHQRRGYYYTDSTWVLSSIIATEGELLAFFLSVELARRYLGTSFEQPLRDAVAKLAQTLPSQVQLDLSQLMQHYTFQAGATSAADPALLLTLHEAISERWPIAMEYFTASRGERNRRVFEPYHLYNVRGDWQVIGFDHLRQQFRNFAVSRIETWQVQKGKRFSRDPDFSVESYLASGFLAERGDTAVEVVVWFDAYQAHYMRARQFHSTQQIEEHTDGSLTLRFQSGALAEVRRWVMSFGSHARVQAPESLADEIRVELRASLQNYEHGPEP